MRLLTPAHANAKTAKNGDETISYILHMAPAKLSGWNTCPAASSGCAQACLNTAGRGRFQSTQDARIWRTVLYYQNPTVFMDVLYADLNTAVKAGRRLGKQVVVRLNGTSDLDWRAVIRDYPTIQFYDYTKLLSHLADQLRDPLPNYDLTFSRSEDNDRACARALSLGFRVAVVFKDDLTTILAKHQWASMHYMGASVIDGDGTDLRYKEPGGVIVALKAKGKARKDQSGFVVSI